MTQEKEWLENEMFNMPFSFLFSERQMTNIVGDQNRRGAAKSQRKLWDVKSGQNYHYFKWDGKLCTEACGHADCDFLCVRLTPRSQNLFNFYIDLSLKR